MIGEVLFTVSSILMIQDESFTTPHYTTIMSGRRGSTSVEHLKLLRTAFYGAIPVTQRGGCGIKWEGLDLLSSILMMRHGQNNPLHMTIMKESRLHPDKRDRSLSNMSSRLFFLWWWIVVSPPFVPPLDRSPLINVVDVGRQPLDPSLSDPFPLINIVDIGRQPDRSIEAIKHISDASTKHGTTINNVVWLLPPMRLKISSKRQFLRLNCILCKE